MTINFNLNFADWQLPLLSNEYNYKVLYGGRGGGKSYAIAEALLILSMKKKCVILCGREFQNSIKQSVHSLLKLQIQKLGFQRYFKISRDEITCLLTKTTFYFYGFNRNIDAIKSIPDIKYLWIEEAAKVKYDSWDIIDATVRDNESQIWISFNPELVDDVIFQNFIVNTPEKTYLKYLTFRNNLYLDKALNTLIKANNLLKTDYDKYLNVYEGHCKKHSDALVFKRGEFAVRVFEEPEKQHCYYGLDFGFVSPMAAIRCYIIDNKEETNAGDLYITHEAYARNLTIDKLGKFLESKLPDVKKRYIYADSANPSDIIYLKNQRYNIEAVKKGKGSVESGIKFLKAHNIIIHPRCVETIKEFHSYSHKIDERSGDVMDDLIDDNNHCIDALRYSIERIMNNRSALKWYAKIKVDRVEELGKALNFPSDNYRRF
jgi:phage terminase large subunit